MATATSKAKKGGKAGTAKALSTEIIVILDRSGSMALIKDDMVNGYQSFMDQQRKMAGNCTVTLVTFDSVSTDIIHEAMPVAKVPTLVLDPRGSTPLLDAVGQTVNRAIGRIDRSTAKPDKVLVLVLTDGQENASHEFTKVQVRELIAEQERAGWVFSFLGANQDAFAEAGSLGVRAVATANYIPDSVGVAHAFNAVSIGTSMLRGGSAYTVTNMDSRVLQHQEPSAITVSGALAGASKGGAARARSMTSEERSESAKKASNARWRKVGL